MKINKSYGHQFNGYLDTKYFITISCECEKNEYNPFMDLSKFCEERSTYLDIHKLMDQNFYEESGINFIIEKVDGKEKIIPIGLVDFVNEDMHRYRDLKLSCKSQDKLHLVNDILKLIDMAIKIKYEAIKFQEKVYKNEKEITIIE